MIKAVIFDFGRVLTFDQNAKKILNMQKLTGLNPEIFNKNYFKYRSHYDKGEYNGIEFWKQVTENRVNNLKIIKKLINEDIKSWININNKILNYAFNFKKVGIKIGILSNMPPDLRDYIFKKLKWIKEFDVVVFSCDIKCNKPDKKIFQFCINKLHVDYKESVFIDDTKTNVDAAANLGMKSILFDELMANKQLINYKLNQ